jgi:phenazine biosynthesis protein phzE
MVAMRALISRRLRSGLPLLAVCLSHQVLCDLLGLTVAPLPRPYQGTQRRVPAFGRDVRVGFYNTFAARVAARDVTEVLDGVRIPVSVAGPVPGAGGPDGIPGIAGREPTLDPRDREAVVWADPDSGEVFAVRGAGFASTQFHLESVLSTDGLDLLVELLESLLVGAAPSPLRIGAAVR